MVDPDDARKSYRFDLLDRVHGACFNIGMGPDRTPLISWSDLYNFYQLPDGTKWAEHGCLYDREDLVTLLPNLETLHPKRHCTPN